MAEPPPGRSATLTAEEILDGTEEVLRRFGPAKANVVDVARALGVSHGSVYRHFPSKAALREAVTRRWLERSEGPLAAIAASRVAPPARLQRWLTALFEAKRHKALDDPELFATYSVLAAEHSTTVDDHVHLLVSQLASIIEAGVTSGDFATTPPRLAAQAVWDATIQFHHPAHAHEWAGDQTREQFRAVCSLVVAGLAAADGSRPRRAAR